MGLGRTRNYCALIVEEHFPDQALTATKVVNILIVRSARELLSISSGALLGAIIATVLTIRGLQLIGFATLFAPIGILVVSRLFLRRHHKRFHDLVHRFVHWFLAGVGGAFVGILIAGAIGLYVISPPVALLATVLFLVGLFFSVFLLNVSELD
jgi:hypothetical protein